MVGQRMLVFTYFLSLSDILLKNPNIHLRLFFIKDCFSEKIGLKFSEFHLF